MKKNIEKLFEDLKSAIEHDTYVLSRDDIDAIVWRLNDVKQFIISTYKNRGK